MPFDGTDYRPDVALEPWRDVLLRAADRLERIGWSSLNPSVWLTLSMLLWPKRRECALVAIINAARDADAASTKARIRFMRHIGGGPIHCWNDAPGRTAAEVCAALRACARS